MHAGINVGTIYSCLICCQETPGYHCKIWKHTVTTQLLSREPQSSLEYAISSHLYSKKTCAQYLQLCIETNILVLCSILYMVKNSRLGIDTLTRAYLSSCTVTVSTHQFLQQWLVALFELVALSEFVVQC